MTAEKMFVIHNFNNFNKNDFIDDVDFALCCLNNSANYYYKKWKEDVSNYYQMTDVSNCNNPAPEKNSNFSKYLFQRRRSKLLRQLKTTILKYINNDFLSEKTDFLTKHDLNFLIFQPEISLLFDKHSIQILN